MSEPTGYDIDVRQAGALCARALYERLKLRVDIFVVEQNCPYPELDGKDFDALHMRLTSDGVLLAAARIFEPGVTAPEARIGRVVVSPDHRGKRLGDAIMREALRFCGNEFADSPVILSAQKHLERFYASHGFATMSDDYLEDGIPHVDMRRAP